MAAGFVLALLSTAAVPGGAAFAAAEPVDWRFDFGSSSSPVADGYVQVSNTLLYDGERGYGLDHTVAVRDRGEPDAVRRDFTVGSEYGFAVDVPNGEYRVTVYSGDWIAGNNTTVSVEGSQPETVQAETAEFAVWVDDVTVSDEQMSFVFGQDGRVNGIEITQLFPPTGLRVEDKRVFPEASVDLAWEPVADAEAYHVYRADAVAAGEPRFVRVGSASEPRFTDDTGGLELGLTYVYAVSQEFGGLESDISEPVAVTIAEESLPAPDAPVVEVESDPEQDTFTLRWDPVEEALVYRVYRAGRAAGEPFVPFERIATTEETQHLIEEVAPSDECCYAYYYRVVAVGAGGASDSSDTVELLAGSASVLQWWFDFGSSSSPVADGYVQVSNALLYDGERGYGLDRTTAVRDRGEPDALRRDFTVGGEYGFAVDVPNGEYRVTVSSGDWIAGNNTTVSVEGSQPETVQAGAAEFAVWAGNVTVSDEQMSFAFGQDGRVNGIEITQLFPPTGLQVVGKTVLPDAEVDLAWEPVADAEAYHVYRADAVAAGEPQFVRVGSASEPRFTDDTGGLELGLTYVYAVSQEFGGSESDLSGSVSATIADDTLPAPDAPVVEIESDPGRDTFTLRWEPVDGALAYDVYESPWPDGPFERVIRTDRTSMPIDQVAPSDDCCYGYHYRVEAVGEGGLSAPSGVADLVLRIEPDVMSTFDIGAAGGGARPLMGDVTGDGRLDVVMMQPYYIGSYLYEGPLVAALTAYDIEGNLLWQVGEPDSNGRNNSSDIPAQIYDIDGDGRNEVVAIMHPDGDRDVEGRFYVFDGSTGEPLWDFALPHPEAHDAISFVNLSGADTAQEILLKDRYWNAWAVDAYGTVLWHHETVTGHYPWPYDFDGDGRQEIMVGKDLVGPDGEVLWTADTPDHTDTMWVGDIDENGSPDVVLGADGTVAYDGRTGSRLWLDSTRVDSQNAVLGDFLPERPGLETLGLDRIDRTANGYDGLFLLDRDGAVVWEEERTTRGCWGSIPEPIHNWDGEYSDLIMVAMRGCGEPSTIMRGDGEVVSVLGYGARMWAVDFCGDDKPEVLEHVMGESVTIKSNGPCAVDDRVTGQPQPQAKRLHNFTRYTAGEAPSELAAGRTTITSTALGDHPGGYANDGDDATAWRARKGLLDQYWQVDLGRWYTLTGIDLTFPQSPPGLDLGGDAYRFGYTVEVSKDGENWVQVLDRTDSDRVERTQRARFNALGQYVRVTFTGLPPIPAPRAGLAEVGILGMR